MKLNQDDLCKDCQVKIAEATSKLSKFDLIRPHRLATKFLNMLCKDCREKAINKVKGK